MSSTGRNKEVRIPNDAYATPPWVYKQFEPYLLNICESFRYYDRLCVLESCAGNGNLVRELKNTFIEHIKTYPPFISSVEIRKECNQKLLDLKHYVEDCVFIKDFLQMNEFFSGNNKPNLIFTNPPYGGPKGSATYEIWLKMVKHGIECLADNGVLIFLLRLAVLETKGRNEWMRTHTPDVYVLPQRPSFTGKGSDSCAYAWMVWHKNNLVRDEGRIIILPVYKCVEPEPTFT